MANFRKIVMWFLVAFSDIFIVVLSLPIFSCVYTFIWNTSTVSTFPLSSSLNPAISLYSHSSFILISLLLPKEPPYLFLCSRASPLSSSPDIMSSLFIPLVKSSFKLSVRILGFSIPTSFQLEPSSIYLSKDWILSSSLRLSWSFPWAFCLCFLGHHSGD